MRFPVKQTKKGDRRFLKRWPLAWVSLVLTLNSLTFICRAHWLNAKQNAPTPVARSLVRSYTQCLAHLFPISSKTPAPSSRFKRPPRAQRRTKEIIFLAFSGVCNSHLYRPWRILHPLQCWCPSSVAGNLARRNCVSRVARSSLL